MSQPTIAGVGPVTCSTSLTLALTPDWIADVNGYYRDLGVSPRASKGDIARAYFERGRDDAHLTFVVKQLLNPEVRRAYDLTPMGHVFLDEEVAARLRDEIIRRSPRTPLVSEGGDMLVPSPRERILSDLPGVVDKTSYSSNDGPRTTSDAWGYSYFVWDAHRVDEEVLRRWQEDLTVSLGSAGHRMEIAVGVVGGAHPDVEVRQVEGSLAVFLHENCIVTRSLVDRAIISLTEPLSPLSPSQNRDRKMSQTTPSFRRGTEEAKEASKGAAFAKTHYFGLDSNPSSPNNQAILRFLTDYTDLIVVDQHSNVPTKPQPSNYEGTSWPSHMGAVCRKDPALSGMFPDCYICDNLVDGKSVKRASARSWAYAVLREEVIEDGQVVGLKDTLREVADVDADGKATGETHMEKAIVVVNMAYRNFFSVLEGFGKHYGTILDRDYLIRRNGDGTSTTYSVIPMDPILTSDNKVFDLRLPEFADRYQPSESLDKVVLDRASDDFYARFFDRRVAAPDDKGKSSKVSKASSGNAEPPARPSAEADGADRLAALADRVKHYSAPSGGDEGDKGSPEPAPKTGGMRQFD